VFFSRILWVASIAVFWSACGGKAPRPDVVRVAVVTPQDLSRAGSDRVQAVRLALTVPFAGLADAMVFSFPTRRQAADVSPHFVVEPLLDAKGIVIQVFDGVSQRHLQEISCALADCAPAVEAVIGVTPRKVPTPALFIPPDATEEQFAALARQFPDAGVVYEEWINFLATRGRQEEAGRVVAQALRRPWPALEKAQFEVAAASMRGDLVARSAAVRAAAKAWPANAPLQLQAAEGLNQRRQYREAIPFFRAALRAEPTSFPVYAGLGMTQALAGEKPELKPAQNLAEFDLTGDVAFLRGEFAAAEAAYLAAAEKDPAYQLGRLYAKAGEAALLQNQRARADAHMQRFFGLYQQGMPAGIGIVQGLWLWRTGQRAEAVRQAETLPSVKPLFDFLKNPAAGGPPPVGPALQALAQGRAEEAARAMAGFIGQQPLMVGLRWDPVLAVALAEAGKQGEACALLTHWGVPASPDDWSGAVVWPRQLGVRADCLAKTDPERAKGLRALVESLQPR
jgi:tetratricopeptide (TPR) repeat protein